MADIFKASDMEKKDLEYFLEVNYNFGSDSRFTAYIELVKNEKVKAIVKYARKWLKTPIKNQVLNVFNRLENLVEDYLDDKIFIDDDDLMAFEMLGRQYEALSIILKNSFNSVHKKICRQCYDRSINLFAKALQKKRAINAYKRSPFFKEIEKLKRETEEKQIETEELSPTNELKKINIKGIEEIGPGHYKL